jgi:hypothetical protein
MENLIFIAGGGRYGLKALKHFRGEASPIIVCDLNPKCQASAYVDRTLSGFGLEKIDFKGLTLMVCDCVKALTSLLLAGVTPKTIIPTVPFHLAGKTLAEYLSWKGLKTQAYFEPLRFAFKGVSPGSAKYRLNGEAAMAVVSRMPFHLRCAPGCGEPTLCPVTGRRLIKPVYRLVREALVSEVDVLAMLESVLMAPDVGGYSGEKLKQALDLCLRKAPCTVAIATASQCHAVINAFKIFKQ